MEPQARKKADSLSVDAPVRPVGLPRPLSVALRYAHFGRYPQAHRAETARLKVRTDFTLVLQVSGSTWVWSEPDGGSVDFTTGSVLFLPPGFTFAYGIEPTTHMPVMFDLDSQSPPSRTGELLLRRTVVRDRDPLPYVPRFALRLSPDERPLIVPLVTKVRSRRAWQEQFQELIDLYNRRAHDTLEGRLHVASVIGFALTKLAAEAMDGDNGTDPRILDLVRKLDGPDAAALGERPTIAQLAALAHMSERSFRAAFVQTMGCPPRRYVEDKRIHRAARLLIATDMKATEIAESVGYTDPYHFSRVFRRVLGVSPRQYKRNAFVP